MNNILEITADDAASLSLAGAVRVGRLVVWTAHGEPIVNYMGNTGGALVARATTAADSHQRPQNSDDTEVLLVFENGDPTRPIIVGFLAPRRGERHTLASGVVQRDSQDKVTVDGRVLEFYGRDRIVLSCGKSSIALHADGSVIVKGTRLLSRASESNRIKGATIALN